jgi:predicted phage-related endonuclease
MSTQLVTIGGSRIAAANGIGPKSAITLAAEMLHLPGFEPVETEAMRLGKVFERHVADYAVEQGYDFLPAPDVTLHLPSAKWAVGRLDGYTTVDEYAWVGEVKVTNGYGWPKDGVPDHYEAQGQWYCMLTGLPGTRFFCLIGGTRFAVYDYPRNDKIIGQLFKGGDAFRRLVKRAKLPEPDGSDDAHATIRKLHPDSNAGEAVRATGELAKDLERARALHYSRDETKRQYDEVCQRIQLAMGTAEILVDKYDQVAATFKHNVSNRFNRAAFDNDHPGMYAEYTEPKGERRFLLK